MKTVIVLENGKEVSFTEFCEMLSPWRDSNEDDSVSMTPFVDIDGDTIDLVITRKKTTGSK